jgi:hypothetical protein
MLEFFGIQETALSNRNFCNICDFYLDSSILSSCLGITEPALLPMLQRALLFIILTGNMVLCWLRTQQNDYTYCCHRALLSQSVEKDDDTTATNHLQWKKHIRTAWRCVIIRCWRIDCYVIIEVLLNSVGINLATRCLLCEDVGSVSDVSEATSIFTVEVRTVDQFMYFRNVVYSTDIALVRASLPFLVYALFLFTFSLLSYFEEIE